MVMMVAMNPVAQVAEVASSGGRSKVTCILCVKALMPTIVGTALDMMMIVAAMAGSEQQQQSHLRFMNNTLSCTLQLQQLTWQIAAACTSPACHGQHAFHGPSLQVVLQYCFCRIHHTCLGRYEDCILPRHVMCSA